MAPSTKDVETLSVIVESTIKLLATFKDSLEIRVTPPSTPPTFEPLDVLYTTATLIRAHTTKLTLLLTNPPFTPSAICTVLRELSTGALPAMMAAVEAIDPRIWTDIGTKDIRSRVKRLLSELESLVKDIPQDISSRPEPSSKHTGITPGKHSFASTGVVWECCDSIIQLKNLSLAGIVAQKAEEWKATLQDAISELKEWSEDVDSGSDDDHDEEDEEENEEEAESNGVGSDIEDALDGAFNTRRLPKNAVALRTQLDQTLKKLRLIDTLYVAVIKRRLKTIALPATVSPLPKSSRIQNLDTALEKLSVIPEHVDDLIGEYYELNSSEAVNIQDKCISLAKSAVLEISLDWEGKEDVFTTWSRKWLDAIDLEIKSK